MPLDSIRRLRILLPVAAARFLNQALDEIKEPLCGKGTALNDEFSVRLFGLEHERLDNDNCLFTLAFHYSENGHYYISLTKQAFQTTVANGSEC